MKHNCTVTVILQIQCVLTIINLSAIENKNVLIGVTQCVTDLHRRHRTITEKINAHVQTILPKCSVNWQHCALGLLPPERKQDQLDASLHSLLYPGHQDMLTPQGRVHFDYNSGNMLLRVSLNFSARQRVGCSASTSYQRGLLMLLPWPIPGHCLFPQEDASTISLM